MEEIKKISKEEQYKLALKLKNNYTEKFMDLLLLSQKLSNMIEQNSIKADSAI